MQRRRTEHVGRHQARCLLLVADATQPLDAGVAGHPLAQHGRLGAVTGDPQPHVRRELVHGLEQHGQPLAGLVAADEEDRRALGGPRRGLGEALDLHAVEQDGVAAARAPGGPCARRPRCTATRRSSFLDSHFTPGREPGVGLGAAGGVEGADQRCGLEEHGRLGRPGAERLVDVDHVERLVAQGPDGAQLGRRVRGDRGHRAVGHGGHAVAQGCDPGVGRWTVAGAEHPHVVARAPQRPGQAQDLALHAARQGQAVRADDADAHHPTLVPRAFRPPLRPSPGPTGLM